MILKRFFTLLGARADARLGLDSGEDRIVAELGPRPTLDVRGNPEHARLVASLDRTPIDEIREDITRAENEAQEHAAPWLLGLGLAVAVAIEVVGALLLTKALGLSPGERLPLGIALAFAVIGLTALAGHRRGRRATAHPGDAPPPAGPASVVRRMVVYAAYAAVVLAITVIRLRNAGDEDATTLELLAEAALLVATTLGPAWACEYLMKKRAPAVATGRALRLLRRRLRDQERARTRAQTAVDRIARQGATWDAETARRRALYRTEHRLAAARLTRPT